MTSFPLHFFCFNGLMIGGAEGRVERVHPNKHDASLDETTETLNLFSKPLWATTAQKVVTATPRLISSQGKPKC